jgi:hypothetical protein
MELMTMLHYKDECFTVTKEVEVSLTKEDITEALDLNEVIEIFDPQAEELLECLDADEVIAWVVHQPEFLRAIPEIMGSDDIASKIIEHINASDDLRSMVQPPAPPIHVLEWTDIMNGCHVAYIDGKATVVVTQAKGNGSTTLRITRGANIFNYTTASVYDAKEVAELLVASDARIEALIAVAQGVGA